MAYKTFQKGKSELNVENAVIEILRQKPIAQNEIKEILETKYDLPYTRMGLWKILNRMEQHDQIYRSIEKGNPKPIWNVHRESQINTEIDGKTFQVIFTNRMAQEYKKILNEFKNVENENTSIKATLEFFGFYVIGSIIAGRALIKDSTQREIWYKQVLDLQNFMITHSYMFERLCGGNENIIKKFGKSLTELYPVSSGILRDSTDRANKRPEIFNKKDLVEYNKILKSF